MLHLLADETRLRIVLLLLRQDFCVGALANRIGISPAAVSQHLQVLRRAGLVRGEKRGYWTHYVVERSALYKIARFFLQLADTPPPDVSACARILERTGELPERGESDMCTCCCKRPEKLKERPEICSPEQIKECHGEVKEHPCENEERK
ncbi:MAG: metalloregulator ArsR/SmtB family transcription factor [Bacillota bacterium]